AIVLPEVHARVDAPLSECRIQAFGHRSKGFNECRVQDGRVLALEQAERPELGRWRYRKPASCDGERSGSLVLEGVDGREYSDNGDCIDLGSHCGTGGADRTCSDVGDRPAVDLEASRDDVGVIPYRAAESARPSF